MYMITPNDHISQHLSYFSGPSTSGAEIEKQSCMSYIFPINIVTLFLVMF